MSALTKIQSLNPQIRIQKPNVAEFSKYGKLHEGFVVESILKLARERFLIGDMPAYEASVAELEADGTLKTNLERRIYGGLAVQIGCVYGKNYALNALEYHKGSETHIALYDAIILAGRWQDISWIPEPSIQTSTLRAFYIPAGSVVELYAWTLHYCPINICRSDGFCDLVVLPRGSNTALDFHLEDKTGEYRLLFARNNWLMSHPENKDLLKSGAWPGLQGENITINPLD